jgi:hypothetical protein
VQIADRQKVRNSPQVRAYFFPHLQPAVERRPEKREFGFRHLFMLQAQIGFHDLQVQRQPLLILFCSIHDIHDWLGTLID